MSELTEFLLARIAEDEARAGESRHLHQHQVTSGHGSSMADDVRDGPGGAGRPRPEYAHAYGPARVLAECEAKRRIVNEHPEVDTSIWGADEVTTRQSVCRTCRRYGEPLNTYPCVTLRALALPYAGHPDYRAEWAV